MASSKTEGGSAEGPAPKFVTRSDVMIVVVCLRGVVWCKMESGESVVRSSEIRLDPVLDAAGVWS